jgi:hypothetical protein
MTSRGGTFKGMMRRLPQRFDIGRRIDARRFEGEDAGIGHPDVRGRIVRLRAENVGERLARMAHRVAIERFERGASFDERAVGREQRIERRVGLPWLAPLDGRGEPVASLRERFDVGRAIRLRAEHLPQARDSLLDAVVRDRDVLPARFD